tara:strand:+ start:15486 stop:16064 length:579 start_codon:yes stop_codon:yes gene_type:complete
MNSVFKFNPDSPRTPPDSPDNDPYGDGISPLTEPNTPEKSKKKIPKTFSLPFPLIKNPQTELEDEYLLELERNYNEYQNVVGSIDYITNRFIDNLIQNPNVRKNILKTYEDAVECYNTILGNFINQSAFVSITQESNVIDTIIESAQIRLQTLYSENNVGGKRKTRKNKKIKNKIKRKTNKKIKKLRKIKCK